MDVTPLVSEGRQLVQAYGNGGFRISGTAWSGPVIVFPDRCLAWTGATMATLSTSALAPVLTCADPPEILLLGCGRSAYFITPDLRRAIRARGPVVDAMDTGAACRTFNVLVAEGRRVAAALMPVE